MGDTLSREFSLDPVDTGRRGPPTIPPFTPPFMGGNIPGLPTDGGWHENWDPRFPQGQPGQPITRPSFLQAFLANLGPALAGGLAASPDNPLGTGLGGALQGIELQRRYNQQFGLEQQQQQRLNQQAAMQQQVSQAELDRMRQLTPLDVQQKQMEADMLKAQIGFYSNPGNLDNAIQDATKSLGKLEPAEQAQIDAAKKDAQLKRSFDPISNAVKNISQNRLTTQRKTIGPPQVQYDSGIPVSVKDKDGTVYDANDPNLPASLKPLVDSAKKAHSQKIQEETDKQARAFAQQEKMFRDRMEAPTTATRTMIEKVPKVKALVSRLKDFADKEVQGKGPLGARWTDFWSNKVGAPNQAYSKMRVDDGLLSTALMQMHVGARGGERIMEHFANLLALGHQSPQNYKAALEAIDEYADDVAKEGKFGSSATSKNRIIDLTK